MKNIRYRHLLFGLFLFTLFLGIGLLLGSTSVQAVQAGRVSINQMGSCPLHTVGLSRNNYTPANKAEVIELQKILSQDSEVWPAKYKITGVFDWGTTGSIYRFQKKYGLPLDGALNKPTLDKLCEFWRKAQLLKSSGEKEDPVSGNLSASPVSVRLGQSVTITIAAHDKQGVDKVFLFYQGNWHSQSCNGASVCKKVFRVKENKPGMYRYYGYVSGKKLNGTKEGAYTQPSFVQVNVIGSRHIRYPLNGSSEGSNGGAQGEPVRGRISEEDNQKVSKKDWVNAPGFNFPTISPTQQKEIPLPLQTKYKLGNSAIPPITGVASLEHPVINITKDANGKYDIKWMTLNDTPVQVIVKDAKGNKVAQGYGKFISTLFHIPLENGKYTLSIVKDGKVIGSTSFDTNLIKRGGQIIHNTALWQYDTKNSQFMNYITAALSHDGNTLNIDYQLNRNQGIGKVVITYPDETQKTLTNNLGSWGTMIEGKKLSLLIDTAKLKNGKCKIDIYDKDGHRIEGYKVDMNKGIPEVVSTFRGATGEGSAYDPTIWQSGTVSRGRNTNQFNWKAKGISVVKLIDPATGKPIQTSGGNGMTVSGLEKGHTYYLVFYDQTGNVANIQVFSVNGRGLANSPHQLSSVTVNYMSCHGGTYQLGFPGDWENNLQISKVTDDKGNEIELTGYRVIPKKYIKPGATFTVIFTDKKTGAVSKQTITVGSKQMPNGGYEMTYSGLQVLNGPLQPQYKVTSEATSKGGEKVTVYSNGYNTYVDCTALKRAGLQLVPPSKYHGTLSLDKYTKIYNNYLKTGKLPVGDWWFVDSKGSLVLRTYVFQDGRVRNIYDKTKVVKSSKDIQKDLGNFFGNVQSAGRSWQIGMLNRVLNDQNVKNGHTTSLTKTMKSGIPYTVTVNPLKDTVTVTIGSISKTFSNIEEVKKYLEKPLKTPPSRKLPVKKPPEKKPPENNQLEDKRVWKKPSPDTDNNADNNTEDNQNPTSPPKQTGPVRILYRRPSLNLAEDQGSFWHNFMAFIFGLWSKVIPQNK